MDPPFKGSQSEQNGPSIYQGAQGEQNGPSIHQRAQGLGPLLRKLENIFPGGFSFVNTLQKRGLEGPRIIIKEVSHPLACPSGVPGPSIG